MRLFNCEHPKTITNPYTGDVMTVPCHKCPTCRQRKSLEWVDKLEKERKSHPYSIFFTLTYSDAFLPHFVIKGNTLLDTDTGEYCVIPDELYQSSKEYLERKDFLCHPSVKDLQDFIKRLRSKVCYYEKDKHRQNIRYFIVSEYGPTLEKHRVHYHGILFTDSYWFARNYKDVINSAWSTDNRSSNQSLRGWTQSRFISDDSGAKYTAMYMYQFTDMPPVYQFRPLAPIKLCSRHPALGSLLTKDEDLQKILFNGVTRTCEQVGNSSSPVYKPISSTIKNRLFPKIKGFSQISDFDRVRLYEFILDRQSEIFSLGSFISYLRKLKCRLSVPDGQLQSLYLHDNRGTIVDEFMYNYFQQMIPSFDFDELLLETSYADYVRCSEVQRAQRFYSACNRMYHNMALFGVRSVSDYVKLIVQFDENCKKQNLIEMYDFMEHYEGNPLDLNFHDVRSSELKGMDYTKCPDYIEMCQKSHSMKNKQQKKKDKYAHMRVYGYKYKS